MTDRLIRAMAFDGQIRIFIADATEMVREAQRRHDSWSTATAALGRTLVGTLFLGTALKNDDYVSVRLQGNGPIGHVVTGADNHGNVKGYIRHPHVSLEANDLGKIDVRGGVGTEGQLVVTKDLGLKEPYVGNVPLVSGEIAEDFTYYMAVSEQTPSSFGLSVLVNPDESVAVAGGFMIQVMPGIEDSTLDQVEKNLANLPQFSDLLVQGESLEDILTRLTEGSESKVLAEMPITFTCDCSKDRFAKAIISLGMDEIQDMIDEDHGAETTCQFCRKNYNYSEEELKELRDESVL